MRYRVIGLCMMVLLVFFLSSVNAIGRGIVEQLDLSKKDKSTEQNIKIDWAKKYPFSETDLLGNQRDEYGIFGFENRTFIKVVDKIRSKISQFTSKKLPGYMDLVSAKRKIDDLIHWNIAVYTEYNAVTKLEDGYLTAFTEPRDMTEQIRSVVELDQFCKSKDIPFIYVQQPDKINKFKDRKLNGILDYGNTNADALLKSISKSDVDVYDLREDVVKDHLSHRDLFFKTDHHWKQETGLWAIGKIVREFNRRYGCDLDEGLLQPENFDRVIYEDWFLGSQGKKMTLSVCKPDDITLHYPKFETDLTYKIPSIGIDKRGDFSVSYDDRIMKEKDYYRLNPYAVFNYSDRPLIQIENHLADKEVKILVPKDSFSNVMVPFLALLTREVDVVDLMYFNGSIKAYITETQPDLVMMTHNGPEIRAINYAEHNTRFDLR